MPAAGTRTSLILLTQLLAPGSSTASSSKSRRSIPPPKRPPGCRCHPRKAPNLTPVSDICVPFRPSVLSTLSRSPILMFFARLLPHRPSGARRRADVRSRCRRGTSVPPATTPTKRSVTSFDSWR
eukprot:4265126-Heterocapsa_arctica.AAC.1